MNAAVLVLLLPAVAFASQCAISGDPHYKTWENAYHDFQGQGVFQLVDSPRLAVQALHMHCNPAAPFFTSCIRSVTARWTDLQDLNLKTDVITYGIWGQADAIVVNGQVVPPAQIKAGYTSPIGVRVYYKPGTNVLVLSFTQKELDLSGNAIGGTTYSITIGEAYVVLDLPFDESFYNSNGLCGKFTGTAADEFTDFDGNLVQAAQAGVRYNGVHINNWGNSFAVTAGGRIKPLAKEYHVWESTGPKLQGGIVRPSHRMVTQADPPAPVIPTAAQQAELEKVPFQDLNTMEKLQLQCAQVAHGDQITFQNCMYDGALFGNTNFNWALANGMANDAVVAANGDQGSKTILTTEQSAVLGGVLGAVAAVCAIVAAILYYRLRKARHEYSMALITRNDATASRGQTGNAARTASLNVADNI